MQRLIKFRAWDGNQMFVPAIRHSGYDLNELLQSFGSNHDLKLMQYTGLKDRNGVEIYEGDVVKDVTTKTYLGSKKIIARKGQVKYGDYYAASDDPYCYADVTGFYIDGNVFSSNLKDYSEKELEVIGNIYEHSHLLKANQ